MNGLTQDLRAAVRQLRRSPGLAAAAVVCLALGIGANTAVFSVADSLLFQDRGLAEPERLAWLMVEWKEGLRYGAWSYPDFRDLAEGTDAFSGLAAEVPRPMSLSGGERNERIWGSMVSAGYFGVLGVDIPLGRAFAPGAFAPGAVPEVVLSHGLWQRRFAGDPGVVGRPLTLNGRPFTVAGVAPRGFTGPNAGVVPELWVPIAMQEVMERGRGRLEERGVRWIAFVVGRLGPGVGLERAQAAVDAVMARLTELYPETNTGAAARVYGESEASLHPLVRGAFVSFLRLMLAVVGLVLLLACANVAGLLLARGLARRREIALRLALGAARGRLVRQLLTESLVLALLAGGAGLLLALWLTQGLAAVQPPFELPVAFTAPPLNAAVLGFTFLVATLAGLVFGLVPALQTTRPGLAEALKEGGMTAGARRASRQRRALVVAQMGLSLVLLIGAAMVLASLANARRLDLGFEPDGLLLAAMDLGLQGYGPEETAELFETLERRVEELPGVEAAGYATAVPLSLFNYQTPALPEGHVVPAGANAPLVDYNLVSSGYFAAMGVPLADGRVFEPRDGEDGRPVAVVNRAFARRYWPGESALGKRVESRGETHEVVGVVGDGKYWSLGEAPRPYLYLPLVGGSAADRTLHVRAAGDPQPLLVAVRREVAALDPSLPVYTLETMHDHLGFALFPMRVAAVVVGSFAALALLLAAVGLYGVMAYQVGRETRSIGIRRALGARDADVVGMVVRRGMSLTVAGLAVGLGAGFLLARLATGILYGVSAGDPALYLTAAAVLAAAALVACLLPALRAARIDPMTALRWQ